MSATNSYLQFHHAFREGRQEGLNYIYNKYSEAIYLYCLQRTKDSTAAEDITSIAFTRLWEYRVNIKSPANIRAYLYRIAHNACFDYMQDRRKSLLRIEDYKHASLEDIEPGALHDIIRAEFISSVYTALKGLPPQCRKIFRSLYIDGKNYAETAQELNLSVSTVKNQKARGISILRKKISSLLHLFF